MNDMTHEPGTKPNPDPTIATNEAVERAMTSERDYVDGQIAVLQERLRGIDRATTLLEKTADGVPAHVSAVVAHLRDLVDERFVKVANQFAERDTRSEREGSANKVAVDAAFAAQKEAATKQDEANAKAIDKSERATAETIKTNQELSKSKTDELTKGLDEVKLAISRIESSKRGGQEHAATSRSNVGTVVAVIAAALAVLAFIGYQAASPITPANPVVVTVTTPGGGSP